MNDEFSQMACGSISHYASQCFSSINECMTEPSVLYRPTLSIDGTRWCALYGSDMQTGVAGFGDSPSEAMCDFNRNWFTPTPNSPSGIARAAKIAARSA
ncbi:hypothetical protein SAMN05216496_2404 [Pseudomonas sp. Z003-0.4C(8344-21)]|nr:hypothetical protein SAMN05216496_2404 [Pseudomonas sp. Z003-0.4C(8344-21)]